MIAATLAFLAVLVPGLSLEDQPRIDWTPQQMDPYAEYRLLLKKADDIAASRDDTDEGPTTPAPDAPADTRDLRDAATVPEPWRSLADCESGAWTSDGGFVRDSARWHSRASDPALDNEPPWSNGLFYGGLQFTQRSWDWASDVGGHGLAGTNPADHPPLVQVMVAETLLDLQGPEAWPNCSVKIGLR